MHPTHQIAPQLTIRQVSRRAAAQFDVTCSLEVKSRLSRRRLRRTRSHPQRLSTVDSRFGDNVPKPAKSRGWRILCAVLAGPIFVSARRGRGSRLAGRGHKPKPVRPGKEIWSRGTRSPARREARPLASLFSRSKVPSGLLIPGGRSSPALRGCSGTGPGRRRCPWHGRPVPAGCGGNRRLPSCGSPPRRCRPSGAPPDRPSSVR